MIMHICRLCVNRAVVMNLPMGAWPLCSLAEMLPRELHRQVSLSKGQLT